MAWNSKVAWLFDLLTPEKKEAFHVAHKALKAYEETVKANTSMRVQDTWEWPRIEYSAIGARVALLMLVKKELQFHCSYPRDTLESDVQTAAQLIVEGYTDQVACATCGKR